MRLKSEEPRFEERTLYEGLDSVHTPRLVVPEIYVAKRSNRLQMLAGRALLASHVEPNTQFDVVWLGKKEQRILRATVQTTGTFNHDFGYRVEGSEDYFLPDPSWIESGLEHFTYIGRIEKAIQNGAGIFKPADLGRDFEV